MYVDYHVFCITSPYDSSKLMRPSDEKFQATADWLQSCDITCNLYQIVAASYNFTCHFMFNEK